MPVWAVPELDATGKLALAWFALACLDVATGWMAAMVTRTASSRVSWAGVTRKAMTATVLVVIGIVNAVAPAPLDNFPLLLPALVGYIGTEVLSIFENAKRAGVTIPGLTSRLDSANVSDPIRADRNPADLSRRDGAG